MSGIEEGAGPGELVSLRDGSQVRVRAVTPADVPLFERGFARLGEDSRYRRFFSYKDHLSERDLLFFTDVDHHDHEALGAVDAETGEGLGVARYIRDPADPTGAEAAVAVIDDCQGRGLGRVLLDRIAARAAEEGIRHFRACLLTENRAMLALFGDLGSMRTRRSGERALEIDVELPTDGEELAATLRAAAAGDVKVRP